MHTLSNNVQFLAEAEKLSRRRDILDWLYPAEFASRHTELRKESRKLWSMVFAIG